MWKIFIFVEQTIFYRVNFTEKILTCIYTYLVFKFHSLNQGSQTRVPRAACGPPDVFVRPATSLKLLKLLLKLRFL